MLRRYRDQKKRAVGDKAGGEGQGSVVRTSYAYSSVQVEIFVNIKCGVYKISPRHMEGTELRSLTCFGNPSGLNSKLMESQEPKEYVDFRCKVAEGCHTGAAWAQTEHHCQGSKPFFCFPLRSFRPALFLLPYTSALRANSSGSMGAFLLSLWVS